MKKKRILITAFLLVISSLGVLWCMRPRPRLTEWQIASIEIGMTMDEVEAVLGFKPGDYTTMEHGCLPIKSFLLDGKKMPSTVTFAEWAADTPDPPYKDANGPNRQDALAVRVWFDAEGRVIDKFRMSYGFRSPSFAVRFRLHLLNR